MDNQPLQEQAVNQQTKTDKPSCNWKTKGLLYIALAFAFLLILTLVAYIAYMYGNGEKDIEGAANEASNAVTTAETQDASVTTTTTSTEDPYKEWIDYKAGGFSFKYPSSWEVERYEYENDNFEINFTSSDKYILSVIFNPPSGSTTCIYSDNLDQKDDLAKYTEYDNFVEFQNEIHIFRRSLRSDKRGYDICEKVDDNYGERFDSSVLDYKDQLVWATYTLPNLNPIQDKIEILDLILLSAVNK